MRGYEVTAAANGQGGIAEAILQPPDVILCDIMMPKLDGYKVLESIRTNPTLAHVPFIFLTAKADMADLRRGMTLGADDYLAKPFGMKELVAAIESRLKRQQQNQKAPPPTLFMKTIHGHDERGHMVLQTEDCLYFFIRNKKNFVRHLLGTFQIHVPFEKLAIELDPNLFSGPIETALFIGKPSRNTRIGKMVNTVCFCRSMAKTRKPFCPERGIIRLKSGWPNSLPAPPKPGLMWKSFYNTGSIVRSRAWLFWSRFATNSEPSLIFVVAWSIPLSPR